MTYRLPTIFLSGLLLANAVDAGAETPAQVSPSTTAQPAAPPPAPAPTPIETPQPAADGPVAGTATTSTTATDTAARPSLGLAIGLGAAAVVVLGAGIGVGAVAKSRESDQNGNVDNPPLYTKGTKDSGDQATNMSYAAYALFAVGGALAIADLVVWIERVRKHKPSEAATTSRSRLTATPAGLQVSF